MTANDGNNTLGMQREGDSMTAFLALFCGCMRVCAYALGIRNAVMLSLPLGRARRRMLSHAVIAVIGGAL